MLTSNVRSTKAHLGAHLGVEPILTFNPYRTRSNHRPEFMSYRFFLDTKPVSDVVVLDGDQAHHAIHVMRFKSGDQIVLFDGVGTEYITVIDEVSKKSVSLTILETKSIARTVTTRLTLGVALPKGDRQKFLVEKLVELGVHQLVPLKTNRSVAVANEKVLQRLRKQVIEASKQCGRNTLMDILPQQSLTEFAQSIEPSYRRLIADPYQGPSIATFANRDDNPGLAYAIAIGPEGGFDDNELQAAQTLGFEPVRLGPVILRVETAALAIAAVLGIGNELDQGASDTPPATSN